MNLWSQRSILHTHFFKHINLSYQKIFWITLFLSSCVVAFLLLWISGSSMAQEGTTVSGRLIDTTGNPISDIIMYIRRDEGSNQGNSTGPDDSVQTKTDSRGRFAFSNIHHKALEFDIDGSSKIGYQINVLSVEFGEIALYPLRGWNWSSVKFALDPGTRMENIVVTADIKERPRIRTRVVYADGTPVINTQIYAYRQTIPFLPKNSGSSQLIEETDSDGYFVEYLFSTDYPEYYVTLAVEHQGLYAKVVPFILRDNVNLVLTLDGNPHPQTNLAMEHGERYIALETYLDPPPVWVINPTNGHSYKVTQYQTIIDALAQAKDEEAYLVAINNKAEERWLNQVFGRGPYWIGLSDVEEEGQWKWHSGEPVDYTNWKPYQQESGNSETKDYVRTGYFDWMWTPYQATYEAGSPNEGKYQYAKTILEKAITPNRSSNQNK